MWFMYKNKCYVLPLVLHVSVAKLQQVFGPMTLSILRYYQILQVVRLIWNLCCNGDFLSFYRYLKGAREICTHRHFVLFSNVTKASRFLFVLLSYHCHRT